MPSCMMRMIEEDCHLRLYGIILAKVCKYYVFPWCNFIKDLQPDWGVLVHVHAREL